MYSEPTTSDTSTELTTINGYSSSDTMRSYGGQALIEGSFLPTAGIVVFQTRRHNAKARRCIAWLTKKRRSTDHRTRT